MFAPILFPARPQKVILSPDETRQLAEFAHSQQPGDDIHADQRLLASVDRHPLSFPSLEERLRALVQEEASSHLLVEGLPLDPHLPPSPTKGARPAGKSWWSESALLQLNAACGLRPFGIAEENMGSLVQQIAPVEGHGKEVSSAGRVPLSWHTDLAICQEPYRPHFLSLVGVRNQAATPTLIAELDDILPALQRRGSHLIETLRQPRYRLESPALLQLWGGKSLRSEPRALLSPGPLGHEVIAANLNAVTATDPEAERALQAVQAVLPEVTRSLVIRPGTLLIFNNQRVLHSRPAIHQRGERWLQRVYSRRCLRRLREATASGPETVIFPISRLILE